AGCPFGSAAGRGRSAAALGSGQPVGDGGRCGARGAATGATPSPRPRTRHRAGSVRLARPGVVAALCVAATLAVQPVPARADAVREKQWHLGFLKVAAAQGYSQGEGIAVAVIDSGVDANHPDLRGNVLA